MKQILYDDPNFLGNRLRALRLTFGFTQSSVAEVLGINRSTYSYYESGTTRPDPVVLGKPIIRSPWMCSLRSSCP